MITDIPNDPVLLLSWINTQLRSQPVSLDDLCASIQADRQQIIEKLEAIGYVYQEEIRQFK